MYIHTESVNFNNCTYAYKGRREGGGGRGLEAMLLHFGGKGIISLSYISVEECGRGWEGE
jgi:hypothetical protein